MLALSLFRCTAHKAATWILSASVLALHVKMSLALPLLTDLTKAANDVLYGNVQGEGAFTTGASVKAQTMTAGGLILNSSTTLSPATWTWSPSFTVMATPNKALLVMGIVDATGALTCSATASNVLNQPGLQATLTATPDTTGKSATLSSASLTLDYTTPYARLRAVASPSDASKLLQSKPAIQLSGTTGLGPCVLGARLGADTSSGCVTSWAAGLTYNRMTAAEGDGSVERLNGQQWGVLVSDASGSGGRTATLSLHQLISGGKTSLAADYTLPLQQKEGLFHSSSTSDSYDLTLGVAQRLDTGGLVKARVKHSGQLSLLYQQAVTGVGQVAFTCSLDPLRLNKVAPSFGVGLTL